MARTVKVIVVGQKEDRITALTGLLQNITKEELRESLQALDGDDMRNLATTLHGVIYVRAGYVPLLKKGK